VALHPRVGALEQLIECLKEVETWILQRASSWSSASGFSNSSATKPGLALTTRRVKPNEREKVPRKPVNERPAFRTARPVSPMNLQISATS
jgi:hypothetical protein